MKRTRLVAAASLTLVLVGCAGAGGASDTTTTTTPSTVPATSSTTTTVAVTTTTVPPTELAFDYFDAYGEASSVGFARMRDLAAPGSAAWDYYYHQERIVIADNQTGGSSTPKAVKVDGEAIVACTDAACASDTRYSDFKFRSGRLSSFSVEGRPVDSLISTYPMSNKFSSCWVLDDAECGSAKSIDVTIRSIYRTANNDVYVTFDWVRGAQATGELRYDQTTINGQIQPTTYLEGGGRKYVCTGWATPTPEPGGFNVGYFSFTDPPLGTPLKLSIIMRWDGDETAYDFDLGSV